MRRELIVCDICRATSDAKESGTHVVLQAFLPQPTMVHTVRADLCEGCWGNLLRGLGAEPTDPDIHGMAGLRPMGAPLGKVPK